MLFELWLEVDLGWAIVLTPVGVIDEMDLECLECPLLSVCPLWALPDEFPTDLVGSLAGRGDLPADEVELEFKDAPELKNEEEGDEEWPEALERYLNTWTKYWADE